MNNNNDSPTQLKEKPNFISGSVPNKKNGKRYLFIGIVANAIIWSGALLYLMVKSPAYASQWAIALPRTELSSTDVDVPDIGQSSSQRESLYSTQNSDPRENYKFLAGTDEVLEVAANQLDMSAEEFGQPQVEIVTNATLMQFETEGDSPQQAQKKALAFHRAFKEKLNELRMQETTQQDRSLEVTLGSAQEKLQAAQQRLSEYKAGSGLSSSDQLANLSDNLEQLRQQRAETVAQMEQVSARFKQQSRSLNLSAQQAVDAFVLQSDQLFQQHLTDYSEASAEVANLKANFLPSYPPLMERQAEKEAARAALLQRAQSLLELSQKESKLSNLQRDVRVAEAIFSSTLTRLETSRSNLTSYPSISLLTKPSLPEEPSAPNTKFVLLGTAVGSFFLTTGVISLWLRDRRIQQAKRIDQNHLQIIQS
ncbi:MAG: hypothetical protein BRC46_04675 [Cyanobacteria bacterium QS_6_48_18]|nr:MAG: hypothetical protein BRC46_04675 [Cyanobacteria bacterium QS_6_48_18]